MSPSCFLYLQIRESMQGIPLANCGNALGLTALSGFTHRLERGADGQKVFTSWGAQDRAGS